MGVAALGFAGLPIRVLAVTGDSDFSSGRQWRSCSRQLAHPPWLYRSHYHIPTSYLGVSLNTAGTTKSLCESCSRVAACGSEETSIDTQGPLELPFPSPRWFPPLCGAQPPCSPATEPHSGLDVTERRGEVHRHRGQPLELKILIYWWHIENQEELIQAKTASTSSYIPSVVTHKSGNW